MFINIDIDIDLYVLSTDNLFILLPYVFWIVSSQFTPAYLSKSKHQNQSQNTEIFHIVQLINIK